MYKEYIQIYQHQFKGSTISLAYEYHLKGSTKFLIY